MWEDQDEDQDEDEEDGLAGQLLSDILATSKYGEQFEGRTGKRLFGARWYREPGAERCWWAPPPLPVSPAHGDASA